VYICETVGLQEVANYWHQVGGGGLQCGDRGWVGGCTEPAGSAGTEPPLIAAASAAPSQCFCLVSTPRHLCLFSPPAPPSPPAGCRSS
jgi:hypothetical protein